MDCGFRVVRWLSPIHGLWRPKPVWRSGARKGHTSCLHGDDRPVLALHTAASPRAQLALNGVRQGCYKSACFSLLFSQYVLSEGTAAMRAACVLVFCLLLCSLVVAAEQEFPYTAYITRHDVVVRSGPARRFYATDRMRRGEEVEVYRHENGWCAVRPPQSSFSWVKADELRIGTDGVALVLTDKAACRVGSNVSELRDVTQVKLDRGEEVEVLDAVRLGDGDSAEFWCKITPPSGEFRWAHEDDISREPPTLADESLDPAPRADRWGSWVRSRRTGEEGLTSSTWPADGYRQKGAAVTGGEIALVAGSRDESERSGTSSVAVGSDRLTGNGSTESLNLEVNPALTTELDAINLDVTKIVVDEPAKWQLDEVRRRSNAVLSRAHTALERGKVHLLLSRIEKFEEIRQRSLGLVPAPATTPFTAAVPSPAATTQPVTLPIGRNIGPLSAPTLPTDAGRYDGVGKLTRVISQRPNAPRFALVNPQNDVVAFVSPAPGVNLQSFEGQFVGITGQRGYMPELKKAHVTALCVAPVQVGTTEGLRRR